MGGRRFTPSQWLTLFLSLPGGFLLGIMTGLLQACTFKIGGVPIQWGMAAALVLIWLAARLPSYEIGTRWAAVLVTIGWLIGTVLLAIKTPAGDLVLISDTGSVVYIALGSVVVGVASAWPLVRRDATTPGAIPDDAPGTPPALIDAGPVAAE